MKTVIILLFFPFLTSAYNLAPERAILYALPLAQNGQNQTHSSYFGYSVLLYYSKAIKKSWIIVGAPRANYADSGKKENPVPGEPGLTYRCLMDGNCDLINIRSPNDEMGFIEQFGLRMVIKKEHGWFGAAMSLHEPSASLTVCAPRTIIRMHDSPTSYLDTMHGVCYEGNLFTGDLHIEDKNFTSFNFSSNYWFNPMNGFAVHYPTWKVKTEGDRIRPVVGSPKYELYGTVHYLGQKKPAELPIGDELTQFGYALSSGCYFHEERLLVAGGAPGWRYVGQVGIMDFRTDPVSITAIVQGTEYFEYFGASLATGDINNDGLDDLIVGAPHWKNDNGRVYIFLGNKAGFSDADLTLEGRVDDGLFGYAVTSGDLDGDGFDDIIIGAPWEESGAIYVYNGDSKLTSDKEKEVYSMKPSQRIGASSIRNDILRFGFALAKPVDMDNNGFLDIGVGAYGSGHAIIIPTRPVIRSEMSVSTFPATLPRNATSFVRQLCVKHFEKNKLLMRNYIFTQVYDEDYKRVLNPETKWLVFRDRCVNETLKLLENIRNYVDPIKIAITHEYENSYHQIEWRRGNPANCVLCPIEYKGVSSKTLRTKLAFDIDCGMDDICHAFVSANLEFEGIRNLTWIIGSGDLRLILSIDNLGEPAYLATVRFDIPEGMSLRSILPSCQEERDQGELRVSCDVGNPLRATEKKRLSLDLDMSRMHNASAHGIELLFHVHIDTRSVNRGLKTISIPLHLKANISVVLSGKAYNDNYYPNSICNPSNVSFQHTYQISRIGATPISEARLTIRVPYKFGDLEYLTINHEPEISVAGRFHQCSMSGLPVSSPQISIEKTLINNKIENEFHSGSIANRTRRQRRHSENMHMKAHKIVHGNLSNFNESESKFYRMPESANADIIYLNCSTPNVSCGLIVCNISSFKTTQDVVKLQLHMVIDNDQLTDDSNVGEKIVYFTTEARVDVPNPTMNFSVLGTGLVVPVTTKFYRAPYKKSEISHLIMPGSVLLGLLVLCLLVVLLRKNGFFKRDEKDKLERLKCIETIPLESEDIFI